MKSLLNTTVSERLGGISILTSAAVFFLNLPFVKYTMVPLHFSGGQCWQKPLRRASVSVLYSLIHLKVSLTPKI